MHLFCHGNTFKNTFLHRVAVEEAKETFYVFSSSEGREQQETSSIHFNHTENVKKDRSQRENDLFI